MSCGARLYCGDERKYEDRRNFRMLCVTPEGVTQTMDRWRATRTGEVRSKLDFLLA
jgi:hypothetical protein